MAYNKNCKVLEKVPYLPIKGFINNIIVIKQGGHSMSESFKGAVKVKPLYDRVLVKRLESEQTSAGGIIIPETAQEKTQYGAVVAVGEGKVVADGTLRPLKIKAGDKVLFGKFSGTEVKVSGEEYLILREDEILAHLEV